MAIFKKASYISGGSFQSRAQKIKKNYSKNFFYISGNGTFKLKLEKLLYFFKKTFFLIFQEGTCIF